MQTVGHVRVCPEIEDKISQIGKNLRFFTPPMHRPKGSPVDVHQCQVLQQMTISEVKDCRVSMK